MTIILASTSPARQSILRNAGVAFEAVAPMVDERALAASNPMWTPRATAEGLAAAKAQEVSRRHPGAWVIGADQVLALGDKVFGKPRDRNHCRAQLCALRGHRHALISAVVLAYGGIAQWTHAGEAHLAMRAFSDEFLDRYLDTIGSDCTSSVGGYKVEGLGIQLFEAIQGDHFTILGLPLLALLSELRRIGEAMP